MGLKKTDKEGSLSEQFYKIFTMKETVHATHENNGEGSVKPKPIEVPGVEVRHGDEENEEKKTWSEKFNKLKESKSGTFMDESL